MLTVCAPNSAVSADMPPVSPSADRTGGSYPAARMVAKPGGFMLPTEQAMRLHPTDSVADRYARAIALYRKPDLPAALITLVLAASVVGLPIETIEAQEDDGVLSAVQAAFVAEGAVQCGFCTPGLVMAVDDLLDRTPDPSDLEIREAISGNLCRCTGYGRIIEAVRVAARERGAAR